MVTGKQQVFQCDWSKMGEILAAREKKKLGAGDQDVPGATWLLLVQVRQEAECGGVCVHFSVFPLSLSAIPPSDIFSILSPATHSGPPDTN